MTTEYQWQFLGVWVICEDFLNNRIVTHATYWGSDLFRGSIFPLVCFGGYSLSTYSCCLWVCVCVCIHNYMYCILILLLLTKVTHTLCKNKPSFKSYRFVPLSGQKEPEIQPSFLSTQRLKNMYCMELALTLQRFLTPYTYLWFSYLKRLLQFWLG